MPAASFCFALVMREDFGAIMGMIGFFHSYLRNAARRISENLRFFGALPRRRKSKLTSPPARDAARALRRRDRFEANPRAGSAGNRRRTEESRHHSRPPASRP